MYEKIVFSGSGGQGIQLGSRIFCQACIEEELNVSLIPSYGAEMRGGNTTCKVVVSDKDIASPLFDKATKALILSNLAFNSFANALGDDVHYVIDETIDTAILNKPEKSLSKIQAIKIADENLKNMKALNMVAIGAFIKATGLIKLDSVKSAIENIFENKNAKIVDLNIKALEEGYNNGVLRN